MTPSSKNTKGAPPRPNLPARVNRSLTRVSEPTTVDIQVAQLQAELVAEQAGRREERFGWIAATGLLFTVLTFIAAGALAGTFTSVIYVALLLFFSRRWGLSEFWESMYVAHRLFSKKPEGERD